MVASIVIPTLNGLHWLRDSLPLFQNQVWDGEYEIVLVDSGSTDGTQEWCRNQGGLRLVEIDGKEFSHGKTRNDALNWARGEFILYTVQDAMPRDLNWLRGMIGALEQFGVDAVCGGQAVPRTWSKNPWEWYLDADLERTPQRRDSKNFAQWSLAEQMLACKWDNVNAAYRRSVLEEIPFPEVNFGEDVCWAKQAMLASKHILYTYNHPLLHYHHQTPDFVYERTWSEALLWDQTFGWVGNDEAQNILQSRAGADRSSQKRKLIWQQLSLVGCFRLPYWIFYNLRLLRWRKSAIVACRRALLTGGIDSKALLEAQGKKVPQAPRR
jgi:rhamnosyltransferase